MLRAANPAVITRTKARRTPAKRRTPKPRTIGVGERRRTRKPAAVARQAVAMVGAREVGGGPCCLGARCAGRLRPRRGVPGTGSRSRRRGRSGSAGRRPRPSSGEPPTRSRRPKTIAAEARASARGSRRRRLRKASSRTIAITTIATPKSRSSASFRARAIAVDDDRGAGDDVFAAVQDEARFGFAAFAPQALRGVVSATASFDQADRPAAFGFAEVRLQPDDDLGRVGVREEVGEPRLRRAPRLGEVEDDGGDEFFVCRCSAAR